MELEFEIGDRAQPANDGVGLLCDGKFHEQAFELRYFHIVDFANSLPEQIETFLEREERLLLVIVRDGDDHFIEKFAGTLNDIEVTVCDRIKAAGVNCAFHGSRFKHQLAKAFGVKRQTSNPVAAATRVRRGELQPRGIHLPNRSRSGRLRVSPMMNPSSYKNIAVASTFSPRFEQVLSEARRIRDRFGADLSLIYIGERNDETAKRFRDMFGRLQLPGDSPVHYGQGDPAEGILKAITDNNVDLIVAGALEKETALHPFLGNVARRLLRDATCSVLLFTRPELEPKPLRRIVFVANYSDHAQRAFQQTLELAAAESCERLYATRVYTTFDEVRAAMFVDNGDGPRPRTFEEEEAALEKFVLAAGETGVPIEARCIRGNTGFAASDFVKSIEADLLVVPVHKSESSAERLPNHLAWIGDVIPCNLWLIR